MFIVACLGNPGEQYRATRHNAGFWVGERIVNEVLSANASWSEKFGGKFTKLTLHGEQILVVLPQKFMNRSGEVVGQFLSFYKLESSALIVVHDELDLAPGVIRTQRGGSAGGHNGVRDIIAQLGTDDFFRVRIGIGHPRNAGGESGKEKPVDSWVLSHPGAEEKLAIEGAVTRAVSAIGVLIAQGLEKAQQEYNRPVEK